LIGTVSRTARGRRRGGRAHTEPVNNRAADGAWRDIDNTLKPDADRARVTANGFDLSFARPSSVSVAASRKASRASTAIGAKPATEADDAAAGVDGDLVQLTVRDGVRWGYSLAGAAVGAPVLRGSVAHYADVLPNVDLELAALSSGVKETLTLRSADVPSEYIYPLRLKGLTARIADDGSAEFVDASGDVAVWMPLGYLEDSAVDASGGRHVARHDIRDRHRQRPPGTQDVGRRVLVARPGPHVSGEARPHGQGQHHHQ
jgi:hypothetical protein